MHDSNEMLVKGVKKDGFVKTKNLTEKEDFKKNSQDELKKKMAQKENVRTVCS